MGSGYGVYARQYDSCGQPLAGEFMVNVTTGGNQQSSSVAMGALGNFVIAWTSDQNGIGDDIIAREFNADGSPMPYMDPNGNVFQGPMWGEILVNDEMDGNQRNP